MTLLSAAEAAAYRAELEQAEAQLGPLHYVSKIHTMHRPSYELATNPRLLDLVAEIIGPDILLCNMVYIIKEPNTESFVSWHQVRSETRFLMPVFRAASID